jgi:type I restriction enzyme R subunit
VLIRNPNAVQIGLTATPRTLELTERTRDALADAAINADNLRHFGEPVYEYDMAQGIEDGYLAACEIHRIDLFLDDKPEAEGLEREDLAGKTLTDADTGAVLSADEARERYSATDLEARLLLPERVAAMCRELFQRLCQTGGPEQKTIIFCARDRHADAVAVQMNNLYADWCRANNRPRLEPYAFKCTASVGGAQYLADLRGASRSHFIATTVELLTTGVDVPVVQNIVFFKYVRSPIAFYQMIGRGTRLHLPSNKLMFRVYDFTKATRLFGEAFQSQWRPREIRAIGPAEVEKEQKEPTIQVEGFEVRITDAGRYIVTDVDGKATPVTLEEYKERLAARLVEEAATLEDFRACWIEPSRRRELLSRLPDAGRSARLVQQLEGMSEYDLYDVLADLGYGLAPHTRSERAEAFLYKHDGWLDTLPPDARATLIAVAAQFANAGTDGLENPHIFDLPDVRRAGGLEALKVLGKPAKILRETKERIFAS